MGTLQIHSQARQSGVAKAIAEASSRTGVDFGYLMQQANVESSMNPNAKARTSSATGLYQFIEQTWLRMVKNHGAQYGYGRYAKAIQQNANGDYTVSSRALKNQILNLRKDPKASALMAAELATENHAYLQGAVGGNLSGTDLYLAHFLGAQGASNFLNSMKKNPWAPAASFFPEAARANRGVFYANGKPLSLQAVYERFESKFQGADAPVAQTRTASSDFEERVILPLANDWSNPAAGNMQIRAQEIAASTRRAGLMALASDASSSGNAHGFGRIGGFLSSPVDIMELAQTDIPVYAHDDKARYNA